MTALAETLRCNCCETGQNVLWPESRPDRCRRGLILPAFVIEPRSMAMQDQRDAVPERSAPKVGSRRCFRLTVRQPTARDVSPSPSTTTSPSPATAHQPHNEEQQYRADGGVYDRADDAVAKMDAD